MKKLIAIASLAIAISANAQVEGATELITAIEQVTGWTRQELVDGLAMLERACSNDCLTAAGRVKWHGKVVTSAIDTNQLIRTSTHEDGFVHAEPFLELRNRTLDEQLSAAERAAKRESARIERLAAERQKKVDRLQYLMAHESDEISRLNLKYPPLLSGLLFTNEVNTLKTELGESVGAVITPQD